LNPATKKLEAVTSHHTLINLVLWLTGPLNEGDLARVLLTMQAASCTLALMVRYYLAISLYGDHYNW
jgi:UDP-N-acetylglucosamine--dolichyl-phosphate N-acetylglucosaminephosphotransferase